MRTHQCVASKSTTLHVNSQRATATRRHLSYLPDGAELAEDFVHLLCRDVERQVAYEKHPACSRVLLRKDSVHCHVKTTPHSTKMRHRKCAQLWLGSAKASIVRGRVVGGRRAGGQWATNLLTC